MNPKTENTSTTSPTSCLIRLVFAVCVIGLLWMISSIGKGPTKDFTLDDFENIRIGMYYEEVEKAIGTQGKQQSVAGSMETRVYSVGMFATVVIVYDGGFVAAKSQSGLR